MKRFGLAGLVLLTAFSASRCASAPSAYKPVSDPVVLKQSVDLVNEIKLHPELLEQFLEGQAGMAGVWVIPGVDKVISSYDFVGKDDELKVSAIYTLTINGDKSIPELAGYTVYDVKENKTYHVMKKNLEQTPQPLLPSSSKYKQQNDNS